MLPGFTSAGAVGSWPPGCAKPTGDNKIMRGKNATKFFIMTIKGSAGDAAAVLDYSGSRPAAKAPDTEH